MKPFDLEAALKGEPVCMSDGRLVKIGGYNPDARYQEMILLWDIDGYCYSANEAGQALSFFGRSDTLFMAPTERVEWVVVWTNARGDRCAQVYREENGAKFLVDSLSKDIDATIHKITITE